MAESGVKTAYKVVTEGAVETSAPHVTIGIRPESFGAPRPDLAGYRIQIPGQAPIWVIDRNGYRRWIPNPDTFNHLFRDWSRVQDINANEISLGPQLDNLTVLVRGAATPNVYILDGHRKRWITSPAIMDKYNFAWERVVVVPQIIVDSISTGDIWE